MNDVSVLMTLVRKDLVIAGRMRHALGVIALVGVIMVAVMAIGIRPGGGTDGAKSAAIMWLCMCVAGVLSFERTARVEHAERAIDALRMTPVAPHVLYASKLISNLCVTLLIGLVVSAAGVILLNLNITHAPATFVLIVALSMLGLSAVGTLLSIGLGSTGGRADLLVMVVLPLLLPFVLLSCRMLERVFAGEPIGARGIGILIAVDVVYVIAGWCVYEYALEE